MKDLSEIRQEIDEIDREMVSLFIKRMHCSDSVAQYKISHDLEIYDASREKEKTDTLCALTQDSYEKQEIEELFSCIMSISRKRQYRIRDSKS